jgi:Trk K+ transport system NAD-binding subunit
LNHSITPISFLKFLISRLEPSTTKISQNVFLTLSARVLDKKLKLISVVNQPESAEKLLAAGANKIIDPFEICSKKAYQLLTKPSITWLLDEAVFGRADLHMAEILIPKNSYLDRTLISELHLNELYNLFLIGVVDKELGEKLYFSLGEQDHVLDTGDILVVLGSSRDILTTEMILSFLSSTRAESVRNTFSESDSKKQKIVSTDDPIPSVMRFSSWR